MNPPAVSDAGPLHYLILLELTDVLPFFFEKIIVPSEVQKELLHSKTPAPVRRWILNPPPWIEFATPLVTPPAPIRQLHAGETAVLQIASDQKIKIVLMDETAGRKAARDLGFEAFGILALLIRAADHGLVDLREAFNRLRQTNFHISDSVLTEILSQSGV